MSSHATFIKLALIGKALSDEIDDYVESWHKSGVSSPLFEYLGMTQEEYSAWLTNPDIIPQIITARKFNRSLDDELSQAYQETLAARTGTPDQLASLKAWLDVRSAKKTRPN